MPSHTTVLNWTKKQGISQFMNFEFYNHQKWVLIADESIQFGNKKLLLVLAVPEYRCSQSKPLSFKDLTPLVLKVSASWKSDAIAAEIKQNIDLNQIAYCISDTGSNLTRSFKLLNCKYISDVNHKFSLIIQSVYEKNKSLDEYTKALSLLRAQKSMSRIARIVPPNQRIMNRFMNLTPLFEWGIKMIHLLDNNELHDEEKAVLSFLEPLRDFINETYKILICLQEMKKVLKNKGFDDKSAKEAMNIFSKINTNSVNSLNVKKLIDEYFDDLSTTSKGKTVCCSSDIIESCFSKQKEIGKGNKTVGISDLCLCIAAMMGQNNTEKTRQAMETISIKKVKEWKRKNVCKTLFAEKIELNKIRERNYYRKQ
ncbi:MAG: hypothetical protein LBH22_04495 [Bacteroidales bacterium]|jgi:hypothetical protein|nr:hypothetical protein [Bacteroidales bacterium]